MMLTLSPEILGALIGAGTVMISNVLTEMLRRKQRPEAYAATVFGRRLEAYEELWEKVSAGNTLAQEALSGEHSPEDVHSLVSAAVLGIASHTDANAFYLDEDLTVHCCTLFMGVEDAVTLSGPAREEWLKAHSRRFRETRRMILEASGVTQINRVFRTVNKPRLDSPLIKYFRRKARESDRADRRVR